MSLRVLSASDVERISLAFSLVDLQCLMAQVFHAVSASSKPEEGGDHEGDQGTRASPVQIPHRTSVATENHTVLFMPAHLGRLSSRNLDTPGSLTAEGTSIKIVSVPKASDPRGLPATTIVLDETKGSAKAVVNSRTLTALRNAAGSLLSTSLIARRTPKHIVAFGAGNQILYHLDLHLRFFPQVEKCTIVNRTLNDRLELLVRRLSQSFGHIQFASFASAPSPDSRSIEGIEEAIGSADIIICATSSTTPLFPSSWVSPGTHLILIGSYTPQMHEVDTDLILRATSGNGQLLVDSRAACFKEAGELISSKVGQDQVTEIGEQLPKGEFGELDIESLKLQFEVPFKGLNPPTGRKGGSEGVTIFKSVGIGLQDVAISSAVVSRAEELGIGAIIHNYDI
ncbi:hypothetical protein DFP72DRAFT_1168837 [Ephemerocybe angulata]|uniref:NAD(P)-binding protein n=1 Tax=Ephemerocybe angulata TaxID=980116 RepID=A0A8H6I0W5_9AGAR|nr:hypothetical protein DFP72DRAFT_1168837 [Tulosesus angulatus]